MTVAQRVKPPTWDADAELLEEVLGMIVLFGILF